MAHPAPDVIQFFLLIYVTNDARRDCLQRVSSARVSLQAKLVGLHTGAENRPRAFAPLSHPHHGATQQLDGTAREADEDAV